MKLGISISHGQCGVKDVPLRSGPGCYKLRDNLDRQTTICLNYFS